VGLYLFEGGGAYVGNYEKGIRSGLGIHVTKSGSVYSGEHARDLASGVGRLRQPAGVHNNPNASGGEWVGVFDKGSRNGPGRQEDPSGAVTIGTWVDNVLHGGGPYKLPHSLQAPAYQPLTLKCDILVSNFAFNGSTCAATPRRVHQHRRR
jgi:hypothetical protein